MRKVTTMTNTLSRGLALSAAIALAPTLIHAQSANNCGPRASVVETLGQKYGESRQGMGLDDRGAMLEIFASSDSGSWTITLTAPNGQTCLIASGQSFETLAEVLPTGKEDA